MTGTIVLASTTLAGGFSTAQVLRTAPAGAELNVRDAAAKGDVIAVGWVERHGGPRASLRWSTDGGVTFLPRETLEGRRTLALDVCNGFVWAASGGEDVSRIDGWSFDGTVHLQGVLPIGTQGGDIACVGDRALAASYNKVVGEELRRKLRVWLLGDESEPMPAQTFDLGATVDREVASVAATNSLIHAAWHSDGLVRLKTFDVGAGPDPTVTPHPAHTVVSTEGFDVPRLAAQGMRVALAYTHEGDARLKVSDDAGDSFGPARIVVDGDILHCAAVATSLDVLAGLILVEARFGGICTFVGSGHLSDDGGQTWSDTSDHSNGDQVGALFDSSGTMIAEAWDKVFAQSAPQKLRFHYGPTP